MNREQRVRDAIARKNLELPTELQNILVEIVLEEEVQA